MVAQFVPLKNLVDEVGRIILSIFLLHQGKAYYIIGGLQVQI